MTFQILSASEIRALDTVTFAGHFNAERFLDVPTPEDIDDDEYVASGYAESLIDYAGKFSFGIFLDSLRDAPLFREVEDGDGRVQPNFAAFSLLQPGDVVALVDRLPSEYRRVHFADDEKAQGTTLVDLLFDHPRQAFYVVLKRTARSLTVASLPSPSEFYTSFDGTTVPLTTIASGDATTGPEERWMASGDRSLIFLGTHEHIRAEILADARFPEIDRLRVSLQAAENEYGRRRKDVEAARKAAFRANTHGLSQDVAAANQALGFDAYDVAVKDGKGHLHVLTNLDSDLQWDVVHGRFARGTIDARIKTTGLAAIDALRDFAFGDDTQHQTTHERYSRVSRPQPGANPVPSYRRH